MQPFDELIDYLESGQAGPRLAIVEQRIGLERLRIIAGRLLGWLKSRHHMRYKAAYPPLRLNMSYDWCRDFAAVIAEDSILNSLFAVSEDGLDFRREIDEQTKNDVCSFVDSRHHPRMRSSI
jgi:hypothetical protein